MFNLILFGLSYVFNVKLYKILSLDLRTLEQNIILLSIESQKKLIFEWVKVREGSALKNVPKSGKR